MIVGDATIALLAVAVVAAVPPTLNCHVQLARPCVPAGCK